MHSKKVEYEKVSSDLPFEFSWNSWGSQMKLFDHFFSTRCFWNRQQLVSKAKSKKVKIAEPIPEEIVFVAPSKRVKMNRNTCFRSSAYPVGIIWKKVFLFLIQPSEGPMLIAADVHALHERIRFDFFTMALRGDKKAKEFQSIWLVKPNKEPKPIEGKFQKNDKNGNHIVFGKEFSEKSLNGFLSRDSRENSLDQ